MNSRKLCWQSLASDPHFIPGKFVDIEKGNNLIKDLIDFYVQALGSRWQEGFAAAIRLMRLMQRHDGRSALRRALYDISREVARKETMSKIKNGTKATFEGIINTVEIYNGPWVFDSMGGQVIHPVRMWYTKEFMKDIVIKINLYPWIPEIPVIPIEYTGYHTNPKMYTKPETDKWFIKNTVNKRS